MPGLEVPMLRRASALLALVLGCGTPPGAPPPAPMKAGVAKVDITPAESIRLSGYAARTQSSEGVEARLYTRAFAFEDAAGSRAVIITADAIAISAAITGEIAERVRAETGVPRERLAVATTHSHTAPALRGVIPNILDLNPKERAVVDRYTERFVEGAVRAAGEAVRSLAPATLRLGHGAAGFAANRRTPGGPVDQDVPVLQILGPNRERRGILFGYACHCTTLSSNKVTGDWAGFAQSNLEDDVAVAGCMIGCGADANPFPRGTLPLAREHGEALARAVRSVEPRHEVGGAIKGALSTIELPFDTLPSREELQKMLETGRPEQRRLARMMLDRDSLPASIPYPIQTLSLGDSLTFVFLGGEVVVDYALRLKREYDPGRIWPVAYANDVPGYIPSRRILKEGGYEGGGAMVWYGQPARLSETVEELIHGKIAELLPPALKRPALPAAASPVDAQRSLALFSIEPGFEIDLVACEPWVRDPIHVSWDARGRMYVTEMIDYPEGPPAGRIMRLEDTDGDGRVDRGTVFARDLAYPTSATPWRNGVLVTSDPDLLYLEDSDGDGAADVRKVLFTGFAGGNTQHRVNSLQWGLDNWFYGGNGDSAATIRAAGRPPVQMTFADFRFRPDTLEFETLAEHSGYALAFDDWGNRFVSGSGGNIRHVVLDRKLRDRNPFVPSVQNASSLESRVKLHPASGSVERFNDPLDAGFFTAASGLTVYRGGLFPPHYQGNLFIGDSAGNLVHRDVPVRQGATFKAAPHSQPAEFLASRDPWFRPVYLTTGPDGCLYVCDMYRAVIEHPEWIPNDIEKTLDLRGGDDRGRIYRIRHRSAAPLRVESLASLPFPDLVARLESPNGWVRDTAHRLLIESGGGDSVPLLKRLATDSKSPHARVHALWILKGLSAHGMDLLARALNDPDRRVVETAVQLSHPGMLYSQAGRSSDDGVMLRLAARLGESDTEEAVRALAKLSAAKDESVRNAALLSRPDLAHRILRHLVAGDPPSPVVWRLTQVVGARDDAEQVRETLDLLLPKEERAMQEWQRVGLGGGIVAGLARKHKVPGLRLRELAPADRLARAIDEAARVAEDPQAADGTRYDALRVLGVDDSGRHLSVLMKYLSPKHSPELQDGAIAGISDLELSDGAATALLRHWGAYAPAQRQAVLDALFRRPDRLPGLVEALEARRIALAELGDNRKEQLRRVTEASLRSRIAAVLQGDTRTDRQKVLRDRQGALRLAGRRAAGIAVFAKHCANCHPVQGVGPAVGPDLVRVRKREPAGLLMDILDPNASVAPNFVAYNVATTDEVIHSGLVVSQTPAAVTLRLAGGVEKTIARGDIEELKSTGQSLMPPMFETVLSDQDLADVIEYLRQIQ